MKDNKLLEAIEYKVLRRAHKLVAPPPLMDVEDLSTMGPTNIHKIIRFQLRLHVLNVLPDGHTPEDMQRAKEGVVHRFEEELYRSIRAQVHRPLMDLRHELLMKHSDINLAEKVDEILDIIF